MVSSMPRPHFTPRKDPVPIVQEAGWAPGPVWTGAENLAPTGVRSLDRPACSSATILTELPGPHTVLMQRINTIFIHQLPTFNVFNKVNADTQMLNSLIYQKYVYSMIHLLGHKSTATFRHQDAILRE
jgi:hypothetical protein